VRRTRDQERDSRAQDHDHQRERAVAITSLAQRPEELGAALDADGVDEDDQPQRGNHFRDGDRGAERAHGQSDEQDPDNAETKSEERDFAQ